MCRWRGSSKGKLAADAAQHELERSIIETMASIERAEVGIESTDRLSSSLFWALYLVYPVLLALLGAAVAKIDFVKHFLMGSANAALASASLFVLLPLAGGTVAMKALKARKAYHERKGKALVVSKTNLLKRIKTELPMKEALELLNRYDPDGDHRSLIQLPKEYVDEVNGLKQSNAELTKLVDALLATLLVPLEDEGAAAASTGGAAGARGSARRSAAKKTLLDIAKERGIAFPSFSADNSEDERAVRSAAAAMATPGRGGAAGGGGRGSGLPAGSPLPSAAAAAAATRTPARTPLPSTTASRTASGHYRHLQQQQAEDESGDDPVLSSLQSVLPPGSVRIIRKLSDKLPAATPMLNRTARKSQETVSRTGGLDSWIISHVVASGGTDDGSSGGGGGPAVGAGAGAGPRRSIAAAEAADSSSGSSNEASAALPQGRRLRFAPPPGGDDADEDAEARARGQQHQQEADEALEEKEEDQADPPAAAASHEEEKEEEESNSSSSCASHGLRRRGGGRGREESRAEGTTSSE